MTTQKALEDLMIRAFVDGAKWRESAQTTAGHTLPIEGMREAARFYLVNDMRIRDNIPIRFEEELAEFVYRAAALEPQAGPVVAVAGRTLTRTLAAFYLACDRLLADEQAKVAPDNTLIAVLCDAVRLGRENEDLGRMAIPVTAPLEPLSDEAVERMHELLNDCQHVVEGEIVCRACVRAAIAAHLPKEG